MKSDFLFCYQKLNILALLGLNLLKTKRVWKNTRNIAGKKCKTVFIYLYKII